MEDVREMVFFYIARLFEEIRDECLERNQRASAGGMRAAPIVGPKCPYHLLCNFEKNRDEIIREIKKAELFLEKFLRKKAPRRPLEVVEWMKKQ